jgi:sporulation integral membrane protein YlbJ
MLWFNNVLPSLLPFMIAANMLILLGFADVAAKFLAPFMRKIFGLPGAAGFALIVGFTSGYPMGAKIISDLTISKKISERDAQHLLAFCNNAGPIFVVGAVGVGMFNSARIGYILWIAHILAALCIGILARARGATPPTPTSTWWEYRHEPAQFSRKRKNERANVHSIGKVLTEAVKNSMEAMVLIGGIIIFFSVVVAIPETMGLSKDSLFGGIVAGLVEVAGGVRKISAHEINFFTIASAAFVIAFGGISIHAQTFHFTSGTGIKNHKYIFAKILHGIIAAGLSVILIRAL